MGIIGTLVNKLLLFLEIEKYFGTSQNETDGKQIRTERVF